MGLQVTIATIAVVVLLLLLLRQRIKNGRVTVSLRPLPGYNALKGQVGRAIESGSQLHISLGQASLIGPNTPTTVAANHILETLSRDGCANGTPPLVTVGEGTILPLAQDSLRAAYDQSGRKEQFDPNQVLFIANETSPYAFAAGVANELHQNKLVSNILTGHFGPEIAIMAEAATRQEVEQVIGTDDPQALAVATAVSDNVLIGEELLVAGAYLEGDPGQLASVQVQDILRWLLILVIIGYAIIEFLF
ncbi:MAG: hypothetical protein GY943_28090 [Chloroflexi bacterium]|nr:hypothetical protein [Chloroflexota bacterium]